VSRSRKSSCLIRALPTSSCFGDEQESCGSSAAARVAPASAWPGGLDRLVRPRRTGLRPVAVFRRFFFLSAVVDDRLVFSVRRAAVVPWCMVDGVDELETLKLMEESY